MAGKQYQYGDKVIRVEAGLGGNTFGTMYFTPGRSARHRIKSPALPMRYSREEAQQDLDEWAAKMGLPEVPAKGDQNGTGTN